MEKLAPRVLRDEEDGEEGSTLAPCMLDQGELEKEAVPVVAQLKGGGGDTTRKKDL